jgi:hypothetical protein
LLLSLNTIAQRVTAEDIYGENTGGNSDSLLGNLVLVLVGGLIFWGIIVSKGVRQALGFYALMLAVGVGLPGFIFFVFGKNAAIFACLILVAGLYFYYDKSSEAPKKFGSIKKRRSDFSNDLDYYLYAKTFKPKGKYHFYKFQNGLGIKETGNSYKISDLEVVEGQHPGYWIGLYNDIDNGSFFISSHDIEVIGVDYKNKKFLSRCPSCDQMCRGTVYYKVTIRCPKCNYNWTQRVE